MFTLGVFGTVCVLVPIIGAIIWDRYHTRNPDLMNER